MPSTSISRVFTLPSVSERNLGSVNEDDLLRYHGDLAAAGVVDDGRGIVDFAVNVRAPGPPEWLAAGLRDAIPGLGTYPPTALIDDARESVAEYHGVNPECVLLLSGAAEGFSLIAGLRAEHPVVVHPGFTEPEVALRAAGAAVERMELAAPFTLTGRTPPEDTDLVVIGNPTNPTGVLHPAETILGWCRPGRITVVDEAFMDLTDESHSLAGEVARHPGLVVLRSLTKTFSLAGLRCGYLLAVPDLVHRLSSRRPHWAVGTLQATAIRSALRDGEEFLAAERDTVERQRTTMTEVLTAAGFTVHTPSQAPYLLVTPPVEDPEATRVALAARGVIVRRCDTFPGLDRTYWRLAVRDTREVATLVEAVTGHTPNNVKERERQ